MNLMEVKMKFGILGTGIVGRTLAVKLVELGHAVTIGTRSPEKTLAKTEPDRFGGPPFNVWLKQNPKVKLGTFAEAAAQGEVLICATSGLTSLDVLKSAGEANINGKVLMDISNPLDYSKGFLALSVSNTDSLGEQLQRAFPQVKVVKTLNTVNALVMVSPQKLANGDHSIFVSGNDAGAKAAVTEILRSFGWKDVIDLGDISTARAAEMILPIWVNLRSQYKTPWVNIKVVR
jgi:8-hydroxy-5-deazaflavin:NADPH oxidoreductase